MAMDVSKGDVLAGLQGLFGNIMIPALQKQEVMNCCFGCSSIISLINQFWHLYAHHFLLPQLTLPWTFNTSTQS